MSIPTNKPPKQKRSQSDNAMASDKLQQDSQDGSRQQSSVQREQFSPRATDNRRDQEHSGQKNLFRSER